MHTEISKPRSGRGFQHENPLAEREGFEPRLLFPASTPSKGFNILVFQDNCDYILRILDRFVVARAFELGRLIYVQFAMTRQNGVVSWHTGRFAMGERVSGSRGAIGRQHVFSTGNFRGAGVKKSDAAHPSRGPYPGMTTAKLSHVHRVQLTPSGDQNVTRLRQSESRNTVFSRGCYCLCEGTARTGSPLLRSLSLRRANGTGRYLRSIIRPVNVSFPAVTRQK